ncbi:DUF6093 family protein [Brachybacterium paraconglomeratum]
MKSPAEIEAVLERGRARAASLMTDRVRVWRPTGRSITDGRGKVVDELELVWGDPDKGSPAKAQNDASYPSSPDVGAVGRATLRVAQVHFPYGTTEVQTGDIAEFVSSKNPRLPGSRMRLRADEDKTHTTAVRMNVQEVLRGGSPG